MRLILLFLLFIHYDALAQNTASVGVSITLPSIALLDIEPNNTAINFNLLGTAEAGNAITVGSVTTDNSKWLNFTSAVALGVTRRVTVQVSGSMNGVGLNLATATYAGTGAGTLGSPVTSINLSNSQQTIINNIGGAYTGNGTGNGYNLTYSIIVLGDYSSLRTQTTTVSIIYTLIDN